MTELAAAVPASPIAKKGVTAEAATAAVVNNDDSPTKHAVVIFDSSAEVEEEAEVSAAVMYDSRKHPITKITTEEVKANPITATPEKPKRPQREGLAHGECSPSPRGRRSARILARRLVTPEPTCKGSLSAIPVSPSPTKRRRSPVPMKSFAEVGISAGITKTSEAATSIPITRYDMLAPATPTRKARRPTTPRTRTPAKSRTPSGGLVAWRLGAAAEDDDDGEIQNLTPNKDRSRRPNRALEMTPTKKTKARQCFGSPAKDRVVVPPAVSRVYGLVQKATGSVGGNGCCGAIYGELTVGSMQKVVNCLKEETGFDENSSFIDVGSGLGKPNFHVAQDPGCEISYGLELEEVRWQLSVANHRWLLRDQGGPDGVELKKNNLFFAHGDIMSAKTFDPFTHVYMFDVGFPPDTLKAIAKMFNASEARHLISYQNPKKVMQECGFDVEKVLQLPLHLTVSHEGHMMYLYRRRGVPAGLKIKSIEKVDPFFERGVRLCRESTEGGLDDDLAAYVEACFAEHTSGGVRTRTRRRRAA